MNNIPDHPPPPNAVFGSTNPTAERLMTARRLLDLHLDIRIPYNSFCSWCLKSWPCPDVTWSRTVIERGERGHEA